AMGLLTYGLGLVPAFALIATGKRRCIEPVALILTVALLAILIPAGGGVGSPLAAMSLALMLEAGWIARTRKAAGIGLAAGCIAVLLGAGLNGRFGLAHETISSA